MQRHKWETQPGSTFFSLASSQYFYLQNIKTLPILLLRCISSVGSNDLDFAGFSKYASYFGRINKRAVYANQYDCYQTYRIVRTQPLLQSSCISQVLRQASRSPTKGLTKRLSETSGSNHVQRAVLPFAQLSIKLNFATCRPSCDNASLPSFENKAT